ncbi:hypothetical protein EC991_005618 [Linnemannia zychae]|nr:hypothetical protein EC991_005618 [Linnemannia zychae]
MFALEPTSPSAMDSSLKTLKISLAELLNEVKTLEGHELAWKQVLYQGDFASHRGGREPEPIVMNQDNPAARLALHEVRENIFKCYVKIHQMLLGIKANELPSSVFVNDHRRSLISASVNRLQSMKAEHKAYMLDQCSGDTTRMELNRASNTDAMLLLESLIASYGSVHKDLVDA